MERHGDSEKKIMRFKILVIDDEPILRDSLKVALETSGYEVLAARSGEEGLELFQRESRSRPLGPLVAWNEWR